MDFRFLIGLSNFSYARARTRIYSSVPLLAILLLTPVAFTLALDSQFILGRDSQIHAVTISHAKEAVTLQKMGISGKCSHAKKQATAMPLVAGEDASIDARLKSGRGVLVLEGLTSGDTKVLSTLLLSAYKNYPTHIPGELTAQPSPRYPLAVTLSATLVGQGDLKIRKGEQLVIHAENQLFTYTLPAMTIPSEGIVRFFVGTDDKLYFDSALTHVIHSGPCGSKHS